MAANATVGTLTRWAFDTSNPPTKSYEYLTFTIGKRAVVLSTDGIRGTRSHPVERTRAGVYTVGGTVSTHPGPTDLDAFLPHIMGGNPSGSNPITYPLDDRLTTASGAAGFYIAIDRQATAGAQYLYNGCFMNRATFRCTQGELLQLEMEIEGKAEVAGAVAGLSNLVPSLQQPYFFADATLSYGGTLYQFRDFELTVDNHLKTDRFMNSVSRTDLPALDRTVTVSLRLPFTSDTIALYDQNATSAAVVVTLTNGSNVLTFTMNAVQFPTQSPDMPGREEVLLPLNGVARKTGTTLELITTNQP